MAYHIAIIGTGYIGLVAGVCLADSGNQVTCVDIDEAKITMLREGRSPIYEPGLTDLLVKNKRHLHFTTSYNEALKDADVVFIAVGTPLAKNGEADLQYVEAAAKSIGAHMLKDLVVVNRSTVPVGTGHKVEKMIQKVTSYKVSVISCPEFLREGCAINDFMHPDRVVIGADDGHEYAVSMLKDIYKGVSKNDAKFVVTDLRSAEMIKYASNSFLACQISYINDLVRLCEAVDVDVTEVARGMKLDKRIGEYAFLNAGLGYGGSCFPKDVQALTALGRNAGRPLPLLETVEKVNDEMVELAVAKVQKLLKITEIALSEARIAVLGLSFKPNTDDTRASQSVKLIEALIKEGCANLRVVDPIVHFSKEVERAHGKIKEINGGGDILDRILSAAKDADILILATEWNDFRNLDFEKLRDVMRHPCFLDTRNVYSKKEVEQLGFTVENMGRK